MKLRLGSPHLPSFLHRSTGLGRHLHGHETALRIVQLIVIVVLALVGARLIAEGAMVLVRAVSGFMS